jgi:hypothetical protein
VTSLFNPVKNRLATTSGKIFSLAPAGFVLFHSAVSVLEPLRWDLQFDSYLQRRVDLENVVRFCRASPAACHPRAVAWVKLIDHVKTLDDPMQQVTAINGWFNAAIAHDGKKERRARGIITGLDWYDSPQDAIRDGFGLCNELANLKGETLEIVKREMGDRARFGDVSFVIARLTVPRRFLLWTWEEHKTWHAVTTVSIGGERWVLNNQSDFDPSFRSLDQQKNPFVYMSRIEREKSANGPDYHFVRWDVNMTPLWRATGSGTGSYAGPRIGANDVPSSDKDEPRFVRRFRIAGPGDEKMIRQAFEQNVLYGPDPPAPRVAPFTPVSTMGS